MLKKYHSPHDRFWRQMLKNPKVIKDFFETNLPANIKELIDFQTIESKPESFIDDKLKLQITDLLYSVQMNQQQGYIYLLIEHQSTPDRLMPFRLIKYIISIMDWHLLKNKNHILPIIYPMIVYTGNRNYLYSTDLFDLFGNNKELAQNILWKPFQLIDFTKIPDEKLKKSLWYGITARVMKHIYEKDVVPVLKSIINDLKNVEKYGELDYIYTILTYLAEAGEIKKPEEFRETIKNDLLKINEDKVMTFVEYYRQIGLEQGKQQGIQEGIQQGEQTALKKFILNLFQKNMPIEEILQLTGASREIVESLK